MSKLSGLLLVGQGQHSSADGILERHQAGGRKMNIVGLDGFGHSLDGYSAVRVVLQRLRLDAAQNRRSPALVAVGVCFLAHQVFVAPAAVDHQGGQIALRAAGKEQRAFEAETLCNLVLQPIDGGIVAVHIVPHLGRGHGGAHSRRRPGHRVAA